MFIAKLPQKLDSGVSKINKLMSKRQFLTKPSSWAKLFVGFGIVGLMVWVNINPGRKSKIENRKPTSGQIAGAQDNRITNNEVRITDNPGNTSQEAQPPAEIEGLPAVDFPIPKSAGSELDKTILASNDIRLLFDTGSGALAKNDFNLAQLAYIRITQIAPEYKDAWYYLGYSYLKKFESDPIVKYADPAPTNLDWAIVALNRAHLIAPLSDHITELLAKAIEVEKQN